MGEAADGDEAVEIVTRLRPDVTLMDIRMPRLDGIAATRRLVDAGVPTRVVVLTTFDLDEYVFEALRAGASGFLLKDAPRVTRRVIDAFVRHGAPVRVAPDQRLRGLTPRELEVLGLLARGLSNQEISRMLFVSEGTGRHT